MRVILASIGTDGDIFPHAGLGSVLRDRGHDVILAASAHYRPMAAARGLGFEPLVSEEENKELFGHPDFWNPLKTAPLSARWGMRFVRRQYEALAGLVTNDTLVVANPGVFAAALLRETRGAPLASLVLQPGLIPSSIAPPIMPGVEFLRRAPRPVWRCLWRALDLAGHFLIGRHLNPFRASLGLKPVRRVFQSWLSPQLVIGMFPEWYGPPQPDWPAQTRLVGFPLVDGARSGALPDELEQFCRAGEPPLAFTFGTGMAHPTELFRAAQEACALLGRRGVFLTKHGDRLPRPLPPTILHCEFAPFGALFPRCAAVVHHGGIGTVAMALAAGTPQAICPLCFDQGDNAARVQALGVGEWVRRRPLRGRDIASALSQLLTPRTKARCMEVASRLGNTAALEQAAQSVEALASEQAITEGSNIDESRT